MIHLREVPSLETLEARKFRYPDLDPGAHETFLHAMHAGESIRRVVEKHLATEGISYGRFLVLMLLNCNPEAPISIGELARQSGVTKQTMTDLLDVLERDEFLERRTDPADRRSSLVSLCPAGKAFLDRILPVMYKRQAEQMSVLNNDEKRQLVQLLTKLRQTWNSGD